MQTILTSPSSCPSVDCYVVRTRPPPIVLLIFLSCSQLPLTGEGLRGDSCPPRRVDWETGESLQLCYAIDRALHLRECLTPPVPSSRPSVEHDTLLQALHAELLYSCLPPKPLASHLQHCQIEERFITRPTTCTDGAACVPVLSPPAVGCEELCTTHWACAHSRSSEDPGNRLVV